MKWILTVGYLLLAATFCVSQTAPATADAEDYSGMYSFVHEGEFVQLTVENSGKVTGFISRFGDSEGDKGAFLNQFFKQGNLDGSDLSFTTETVHAVWFDFKGKVSRGKGKTHADEAFYVIKGTLIEYRTDLDKKVSATPREVTFESFPQSP
jgi:hypothetical protein